jgi:hypothetical protein
MIPTPKALNKITNRAMQSRGATLLLFELQLDKSLDAVRLNLTCKVIGNRLSEVRVHGTFSI